VRRGKRVLLYAVLILLVALNVFLIGMLLWPNAIAEPATRTSAAPSAVSASPVGSVSATPTHSPTAKPSESRTPSAEPPSSTKGDVEVVVGTERLLVAASASAAWRATVGDCKTSARVERSTNGGRSWKLVKSNGLAPIVRLEMEAQGNLYAVGGARPGCSTRYLAFSTSGAIVGQTDAPQGVWYLHPKKRDQVVGPQNAKASPCKRQHIVGLASLDVSNALVICGDGSAMTSSNSGRSWRKAGDLPGTRAITAGEGRYWAAGAGKNCGGISVHPFSVDNGTLRGGQSRCATTTKVGAGQVAIGISSSTVWLWAGEKVKVSTDSGQRWS